MSKQPPDKVKELPDGSIIQHGPLNDRIYLMKVGNSLPRSLPSDLVKMAERHEYSKIFVKIPADYSKQFVREGYIEEASIPRFFNGAIAGVFMGYYLDEERASEPDAADIKKILRLAFNKSGSTNESLDKELFRLHRCKEEDVEIMATIYKKVFQTYPFPIHDPLFLKDSMQSNVDYFGIEKNGRLIALSSAEIDVTSQNVEMTDFATLPKWRGNSLGVHLLLRMEKEMKKKGIRTAYTIARAKSAGINITFSKLGYELGGRLKNNTNISGNIESMNIWHKTIC
nr:putative beta-lysine N-acetyltransferase [Desulfobulbaceae bacterium]